MSFVITAMHLSMLPRVKSVSHLIFNFITFSKQKSEVKCNSCVLFDFFVILKMLTYLLVIIRYLRNLFFGGGRTEYTTSLDDDVDQVTKAEAEEEAELTIFYKCHICAIDVPAAFARDHAASVKHRANARIASVAALRMRAIISAHPPPIAPQSSQRFCANCVRIVNENHERTKEHRSAVMHDKKLLDLMTVYVGDDDDDDDSKSYDDLDLSFNDTNENIVNKDCNKSNRTKNISSDSDTVGKITNGEHRHTETNIKECEAKHEVIDKVQDTKTKDGEVIATVSVSNESSDKNKGATDRITKNAKFIATTTPKATTKISNKKDYVQFITKDNKAVKVLDDNYHSFIRKEDTIDCLVCSSVFFIKEELSHLVSLDHYRNKKPNAIDEHCVRKINDIYSHCILCNELVQNSQVTEHHQITSHMEREKQAVIGNPHISKSIVTNEQHSNATVAKTLLITPNLKVSDTKNKSKSTNDMPVTKHYQVTCQGEREEPAVIGKKLISKPTVTITQELDLAVTLDGNDLKRQESKVNNTKNKNKSSKDKPEIYTYERTDQKNTVRCIICDFKVPNHLRNKEEHLSGQYHSVNVLRSQSKKTNSDVKDMKREHIERKDNKCEEKDNKKDHRVNETKKIKVQNNVTENNECSNSNNKTETVKKNDETIPINSYTTVAKTLLITPDLKVSDTKNRSKSTNNKPVTKHYQVTCQGEREKPAVIGKKLISKPTVTITQELDLAVTLDGNDLKRQESKVNNTKNKNKSSKDNPEISYELTDQKNTVRCIICDFKVPNHPRNKEEHLSGQYHSVNVLRRQCKKTNSDAKNMKRERIERKDNKCKEKNNKKDHQVNETKNVKVQNNVTANNECTNKNKTENVKKKYETIPINNTLSTTTMTTEKKEYFAFFTRDNKLVNVLNDNYHSFIRKGDTINCLVCCSVFSNKEEAAHMLSLEHFLNKMPNAIDEHCVRKINDIHSHCILCNKLVKNKNVTKHYQTTGHHEKEKAAVTDNKNKTESTVDNFDVSRTPAVDAVIKKPELKDTDTQNEAQLNKNVPVIIDPYESMMQGLVRCTICDCKVTNNEKNKMEHIEGHQHAINAKKCESITSNSQVENIETKLMDKKEEIHKESANTNKMGIVPDSRNDHFPRQNHVKNRIEIINSELISAEIKHLYGKDKTGGAVEKIDYKVKIDVKKTSDVDTEIEIKVNSPNEAKPSIDWPVIHPYEKSGLDYIRCTICDCQVLNNPEIRKEHLVGSTHTNNVKNKYINLRI